MIKICGQKLSLCCMLLSGWGVLQLSIMGVFYYIGAVNLVKDVIEFDESPQNASVALDMIDNNFKMVAYNCWIACGVYFLFLLFSVWQFRYSLKLAKVAKAQQ